MKCHASDEIKQNTLSSSILQTCKDMAELKIAESIEITNHKPTLYIITESKSDQLLLVTVKWA